MKKLIIPACAVICLWITSCGTTTDSLHTPQGEKNKALAEKYNQAIVDDDSTQLMNLLSDDFMRYGPAVSDSTNKQQFIAAAKNWKSAFTLKFNRVARLAFNAKETVPTETIAGDWVLWWGTVTLSFNNGDPGVTVAVHDAVQVKDGKIYRDHTFWDYGDMMAQQGYKFVPPGDTTATK